MPRSLRRSTRPVPTRVQTPAATLDQTPSRSPSVTITPTRRHQLANFIRAGPVFQKAGLLLREEPGCTTELNGTCLDDWIELGAILEDALGDQSNDTRVYEYYLPVYFWILRELDIHQDNVHARGQKQRPFILGFCCPQGGGKTTMTTFIETLLNQMGRTVQVASLDDFYVRNAEQRAIASKHPSNRLLQYRGMPGTHDLELLNSCLDALRKGRQVSIPRYDKTAFDGRGDRAPKENWKQVGGGGVDVVLLEGWCLGFEPIPIDGLMDEDLEVVNDALCDFIKMYTRIDGMFVIEIANMEWVYDWRLQAERATMAAGRPGLSDEQVIDFVGRFMPAYKQYSKPLYERETPLFPKHELHIQIDENRKPIHPSV